MRTIKIFFCFIFITYGFNLSATIEIIVTDCICEGNTGSIEIEATGTAGPFSFVWEGPGNYESTVQNPHDLSSVGEYTVIVTNAYGCETTLSTDVVTCEIIDPLNLQVTKTCDGGMTGVVELTPTGGTPPFTYQWNTGEDTQNIRDLAAGEYCLTVTDNIGCTAEGGATVESE